jgi:hypothetical protein
MRKRLLTVTAAVAFAGALAFTSMPLEAAARTFRGRVINHAPAFVELKKGNTEKTFYFNDTTKIVTASGAAKDASALQICQIVEASYETKEGRNIIIKLVIVKESDCLK